MTDAKSAITQGLIADNWPKRASSVIANTVLSALISGGFNVVEREVLAGNDEYYLAPEDGWVCFHCGERFRVPRLAALHFGSKPDAKPGCMLKLEQKDQPRLGLKRFYEDRERDLHKKSVALLARAVAAEEQLKTALHCSPLAERIDELENELFNVMDDLKYDPAHEDTSSRLASLLPGTRTGRDK